MRTRTQELAHVDHVDDEPESGPDIYVALSGFNQPTLPKELSDVGIHLQAVYSIVSSDDDEGSNVEDPALGSRGYVVQVLLAISIG